MPMMSFASVDFPPPLGPVMTTNFPSSKVMLILSIISSSSSALPTEKETFFSSSIFCFLSLKYICRLIIQIFR